MSESPIVSMEGRIDRVCDQFEKAWRDGDEPNVERFLEGWTEPHRSNLLKELLLLDIEYRSRDKKPPDLDDYLRRFPKDTEVVQSTFEERRDFPLTTDSVVDPEDPAIADTDPDGILTTDSMPGDARPRRGPSLPTHIGRYEVIRELGRGGFGIVYYAADRQLNRSVAIKVDRHTGLSEDSQQYLAEARILASLDHSNIVPVHDVGQTNEGQRFIVTKFIEGTTLGEYVTENKLAHSKLAELVCSIAKALDYAHQQGLVHRDIKPANILIDTFGKPYVVDFGLALREEDFGANPGFAGTPVYMSPEQASGEGHLVDGTSDVFSLGVVFYELLAGVRPFRGDNWVDVIEQIKTADVPSPREFNATIPLELERICLRALARHVADRYATCAQLADDLDCFVSRKTAVSNAESTGEAEGVGSGQGVNIVPKGLRSFDEGDADFFLDLVPGPRDRNGLPESLRFWKHRIENVQSNETFRVGVVYGPSGCGKTSLVKAGLVPMLANHVIPIVVEASAKNTDGRLLTRIQHRLRGIDPKWSLTETIRAVRLGGCLPSSNKLLIILDQFEQWLHAEADNEKNALLQALRQCDAARVQALLLVRDDYWMMVSRFMRQLDVDISIGETAAPVDLFDQDHAREVLKHFGRAFGNLPKDRSQLTRDENSFVDQVIQELSEDNFVSPIRLAVFAEMVKEERWAPATLKTLGGAHGVGVAFLESLFGERVASAKYRRHRKAAMGILQSMLPQPGRAIKEHARTERELADAAGYGRRRADFSELQHLLVNETRLLTTVQVDDGQGDKDGGQLAAAEKDDQPQQHFQLTHDYLVSSIKEWISTEQRQTRRGRAKLRLDERTALWRTSRERKQLPTLFEWLNILLFTRVSTWSNLQRQMMRRAARIHVTRLASLMVLLSVTLFGISFATTRHARALVDSVIAADPENVAGITPELAKYRRWTQPLLETAVRENGIDTEANLNASLALLSMDAEGQSENIVNRMVQADVETFSHLRPELANHEAVFRRHAESVVNNRSYSASVRFNSASFLPPDSTLWDRNADFIVNELVAAIGEHEESFEEIAQMFLGARESLRESLHRAYLNSQDDAQRALVEKLFVRFAGDAPEILLRILADAKPRVIGLLVERLRQSPADVVPRLQEQLQSILDHAEKNDAKAIHVANLMITLQQMGNGKPLWNALADDSWPALRCHLIDRLSRVESDYRIVEDQLSRDLNERAQIAIYQILGGYTLKELGQEEVARCADRLDLLRVYENNPDPGIHSTVEWLLDRWNYPDGPNDRDTLLRRGDPVDGMRWYVSKLGHTMAVLGPAEFEMGSPADETDRDPIDAFERLHSRQIDRTFAIATREITVVQFELSGMKAREPLGDPQMDPINFVTWHQAVAYCNWLSNQEGIAEKQWCYSRVGDSNSYSPKNGVLSRTGYRLPTEAEWEYACRAGTSSARFFGDSDRLLDRYAHCWNNGGRMGAVGRYKPNDFGLFDVYGNVLEWCHDYQGYYPELPFSYSDLGGPPKPPPDGPIRILRGGAANDAMLPRSATRDFADSNYGIAAFGFRIARTISVD